MPTLVLQLARFGDIYQTWPMLNALKRVDPEREIHVLVRERFRAALVGLKGVTVHVLPTAFILEPILLSDKENEACEEALHRLERTLAPLRAIHFSHVINLTYSPLSSYLAQEFGCPVSGYTRFADGHLAIPDDPSAYVYAQVGVGRENRYHLTDIFAATAGVELCAEDFLTPPVGERSGMVVQLSASQSHKTYPAELWVEALRALRGKTEEPITLIGSPAERRLSETVASQISGLCNRVGETALEDLFGMIGSAKLLLGADSAPIHIANLTCTPALCLSSAAVRFWETGPLVEKSVILYAESISAICAQAVAEQAARLVRGLPPSVPCVVREGATYKPCNLNFDDFSWNLIQALYTGAEYPITKHHLDHLAFQRLFELAELALQQLENWSDQATRATAANILAQIDLLVPEVGRLNPRVEPLVAWFQTERLRIPPGSAHETLMRTQKAFHDLALIASVYRNFKSEEQELKRAIDLCKICVAPLREGEFGSIQDRFQELLTVLHELARSSTKVAEIPWSQVLSELTSALEVRDDIRLADVLQWKLVPWLTLPADVIS